MTVKTVLAHCLPPYSNLFHTFADDFEATSIGGRHNDLALSAYDDLWLDDVLGPVALRG